MCSIRKQGLNALLPILSIGLMIAAPAKAESDSANAKLGGTAGGVTMGEGFGGITDRAYVTAPPNYFYVVEKEPGSFLDCGAGQEGRATDQDGRDQALMRCGVTLTETIVIPAAAQSARIIVHY
ncbi:MAG: hypothetical protein HKN14_13770 [Marinicaulis sp.]|nr:hypothetical protein [Marinicaulis sp.]NNE41975.1 hypothetical protein [Marinicaulis sp.]NNL88178.1 hypothetical protein [Marinicaulis sp.]